MTSSSSSKARRGPLKGYHEHVTPPGVGRPQQGQNLADLPAEMNSKQVAFGRIGAEYDLTSVDESCRVLKRRGTLTVSQFVAENTGDDFWLLPAMFVASGPDS